MKEVALILVHGMGKTERNYDRDFDDRLRHILPRLVRTKLHIARIYYQDILQDNQSQLWRKSKKLLSYPKLRKFLLYGFGDAAGLEAHKDSTSSPYTKAQIAIAKTLLDVRNKLGGDIPLVILAQSLGGQVLSNYIWDSQKYRSNPNSVNAGIWESPQKYAQYIAQKDTLEEEELRFLSCQNLYVLFTTGCNIPIFVAGHETIVPIDPPHNHFEWHNYYDKHDVLGWPLQALSDAYNELVVDHQVAAGNWPGRLWKGWNPLSHSDYWKTRQILDDLAGYIEHLVRSRQESSNS